MLILMEPEEIFKISYSPWGKCNITLLNTVTVINNERFRNARAADMYFKYLINEPTDYYEGLITKMMEKG